MDSEEPMCILRNDVLLFVGNAHVRWTGARAESDGSARVQVKAGPRDSSVWYNIRLYGADESYGAAGEDTDVMCMMVLAE